MRKINEIGKKSLTLLLAFIMVVKLVPLNLFVIAEDVDPKTLIGSKVRIVNDMLYMYREAGSYAIGCDKSELPEVLVILDVETMAWGSTTKVYYKLGTVGRDSNAVLNTHSWTEDYNVQIIEYDEGNAPLTVDDMKVGKYIENTAKALGGKIALTGFVRFEKGEGIEKKQEDFAAEVAAQMNMGK